MDLTEAVVTVAGALIVAAGGIWVAYLQRTRKRGEKPEQEAAVVLDPQRDYITFLRQQLADREEQLRDCYRKRNDAREENARLRERLRQRGEPA